MDDRTIMIVLRLIHIVAGAFWVGAVIFTTLFLFPSVRATGPHGGRLMQELTGRRRLPIFMNAAGGLTMLAGLAMYGHMAAVTNGVWARSRFGMIIGIGALGLCLIGMKMLLWPDDWNPPKHLG